MAKKFNRKYELTIDNDTAISDLRCRFRVEYYLGGFVPVMQVELYNLSIDSAETLLVQGARFSFRAGYENNMALLFIGEIRNTFTVREDVDIITTMFSAGKDKVMRQDDFGKTLTFAKDVVELISDYLIDAQIDEGEILVTAKSIVGPITYKGSFMDVMNQISESYNFEWYIHNELFYAYDKDVYPDRQVFKISSSTGLISTPILTEQGFDVRTLLEPGIRPQDRFEVESEGVLIDQQALSFQAARTNVKGKQRVLQVIHSGDTHSNVWYTELRGQRVDQS